MILALRASVALAALAAASPIAAQQTAVPMPPSASDAAPTADADADAASQGVADIVVTAQRREERLQSVPLAVSAITGSTLSERGVTDPSRLQFVTPSLSFTQAGADAIISIRGVSSSGVEVNSDPVLGVFVDGVYQSRNAQALNAFVDVARVEVLRGPQGTLYGRNTTAGNISIITNAPTNRFEGSGELLYGSYDRFLARGAVNLPVSDTFQLRFAGLRESRDGYAKNLFVPGDRRNDEDQWYVRGSARFAPSSDTEFVLRVSYWDQGGQGSGFNAYKIKGTQPDLAGPVINVNPIPGAFGASGIDPNGNPADPYQFASDTRARRDINQFAATFHASHDFGSVRLSSITAYNDFNRYTLEDSDFSELNILDVIVETGTKTFSQELQLASQGDSAFQWLGGVYFFDDRVDELFLVPTGRDLSAPLKAAFGPNLIDRTGIAKTRSYAVFGQGSYDFGDLRLTVGGRYTWDKKKFSLRNDVTVPLIVSDARTFKAPTFRVALDYQPTTRNLLYASVATGFKSGGFNVNGSPSYGNEKVTSYEIGSKNKFADGRILLNLAAFWSDIRDQQVVSFDQASVSSFVVNAGRSRSRGVEAELQTVPIEGLNLNGSFAYVDSRYRRFPGATNPFTGVLVDLSGNRQPRAPRYTANVSASYDIDLGSAGTITPLAQVAFFGSSHLTEFNTPIDRQKAYSKTDLRLAWTTASKTLTAEAYVENLEDKSVLIAGIFGPAGGLFANYGAPRTYGGRVSVRF